MNRFILVVTFLGGILFSFYGFGQAAGDFRTFQSGNWSDVNTWERYDGATWVNPAPNTPTSTDGVITVGHNITFDASIAVDELTINLGNTLTVSSGITFTLNDGPGNDLTFATGFGTARMDVSGRLVISQGAVISNASSSRLRILSGGVYEHAYTTSPGVIYTAGWSTGSALEITSYTLPGGPPTGLNQTFETVTWNCTSQGEFIDLDGALQTVNGDLNISSTNGNFLVLTQGTAFTLTIGGDFNISGSTAMAFNGFTSGVSTTINVAGNFNYTSSAESWLSVDGDATLNVTGNTVINSSTGIDLVNNSATGAGSIILNLEGDFILTSGTIRNTTNATVCDINFSGTTDPQVFTNTGTINESVNYTLQNGSFVNLGTSAFTGTGNFTLEAGATMRVGSADGITTSTTTGNVRVGGTRTYNANANIVYNGTVAQNLGNEWDTGGGLNGVAVNLEIDNTSGVTNNLVGTASVIGTLTLTSGPLNIGNSNTLEIQSNFIGNGGSIGGNVDANLTFSGAGTFSGTLNFNTPDLNNFTISRSADIILGSALTINGTLSFASTGNLDISGQTLTIQGINGDITQTGSGGLISNSTSNLILSGTEALTVIPFSGSGNQLNNLTFSRTGTSPSYTWNSAVTVNGTVSLESGTLTHTSGLTMASGSTFSRNSGASIITSAPNTSASYNVTYNGTLTTGLELPGSSTALNDLTITGDVTLDKAITVNGTLTTASGTFDANTIDISIAGSSWVASGGTFTINAANTVTFTGNTTLSGSSIGGTQFGNLTIASGATLVAPAANLNVSGTWSNQGTFTAGSGTITFNGANQNIDPAGQPFNNVTFAGTGTKTLQGALDANGTLTISSTLDVGANQSINVAGSWVNSGTFVPNSGTVAFDGTDQTITSNAQPFYNLTLSTSGTKTLGDALDVNGALTIDSGVTLDVGTSAYAINIAGGWTNNGTFNERTGTVTFDGTTGIAGSTTTDFYNVTIAGTLTATAATTNVAGNWLYSSGTFNNNGGTINFNGGANQSITSGGQTFNNVIISGLNNKTLQDNIDINGNLTLNAGTLDVGTNNQINLAGNFDASGGGGFTAGTGLVILDGTTQSVDGGGVTFNDLQLNASTTVTFAGSLDLTSDWLAQAGSAFSGASTVSFVGSGAHSITSDGGSFNNLTIAGTGTTTLQDALDVNGNLTISATLNVGANAVTVAGNWDSGSGTFTPGSGTVTLDGGAQNITSGANSFNDIVLAGTGSKTLQDAFDVNGSLTISSALDVGTSQPVTIAGDWTNNGTFTAASGKVTFDGGGTSNVLGTGTTVFNDIDVTGTTNVEIETTHNLTGTLTLVDAASAFDADGSGNAGVFTLVSSNDNPATDGRIAALPTPANFTGDVTVQRYMSAEGGIWRYITTPVSGLTVADWQNEFPITGSFTGADDLGGANNPSLYIYDETNTGIADSGWVAYPSTANTEAISPGVGYSAFMRASGGQITINQRGPVNKGNFNFSVSYTVGQGASDDGWNLLGNPYPSSLDWDQLWTNGATNVSSTMHIRDNSSGVYATYNASTNSGTNGGTQYIAQGQSFWVQTNGSSPSLAATESMKGTGTHEFFRLAPPENYFRITLFNGTDRDETLIHFFEDALPGEDKYDAFKLKNGIFNLSTIMGDSADMVIQAIPKTGCDQQLKLNVYNISTGSYTLDFSELDSFTENIMVYLQDNFTGTYNLVSNGYSYPFTITTDSASFGSDRFVIAFEKPDINVDLVVAGADICEVETASITVEGTELGVNYFGLLDGVGVTDTLAGTGNDMLLPILDSLAAGTYEYNIIADNGCGALPLTNTAIVTVEGIYEVTQVVGNQSCGSNSLTLMAAGAPDNGGYRWYNNLDDALPIAETTVGEFVTPVIDSTQLFYVTVVNQLGCEGERTPVEATIIKLEIPTITLDTVDTYVYRLISSYESGNQWYLYNEPIPNATSNVLMVTEPGQYSVTVEQSGCTVTSDVYDYEDLVTGLDGELGERLVTIGPNPFVSFFDVHIPAESFNLRKTVITIYDINGKVIYFDKKVKNENLTIDLSSFNNGIYLLNIYDGVTAAQHKLIKE